MRPQVACGAEVSDRGQVEQQSLALTLEVECAGLAHLQAIASGQVYAWPIQLARQQLQVEPAAWGKHIVERAALPAVECHVLGDLQAAIGAVRGGDDLQAFLRGKGALLIARRQAALRRLYPDLHEVHGLARRGVELAVADADAAELWRKLQEEAGEQLETADEETEKGAVQAPLLSMSSDTETVDQ